MSAEFDVREWKARAAPLHSCRAASEEGMLPGGGMPDYRAASAEVKALDICSRK